MRMNNRYFITLLLLLLLGSSAYTWGVLHHGHMRGDHLRELDTSASDLWFTQKLDHFDPTNNETWQQRYFINDTLYKEGGPVFLMIGGEGKANPIWMSEGMWIEYARLFNALCFELEHRYYGKSHPTEDLSVKNLVYLSSEQALADLSYFIEKMNEQYNLSESTEWVAFGGSYPGSLATWIRIKYPHQVHAAVSATYMDVVRDSLATHSEECVANVADATKQVGVLLKHRLGQQHLDKLFRLCDTVVDANKLDISNLYQTLAGNIAGVVQYNKDNRAFEGAKDANLTIDTVCDMMDDTSLGSVVSRYAAVNSHMLDIYDEKCLDFKYEKMIQEYRNTSWDASTAEGGRQWLYQTCTEFGFYQTSSSPDQPFGNQFPVDFFTQQCSDIFGPRYNMDLLTSGIERTNVMYGGLHPEVSRVVFVHGSIDPWHALGVLKPLSAQTYAIYINGTAHCANMYPESPNDSSALIAARHSIIGLLAQWLQSSEPGFQLV
ncbi:hypothetical protein B566_EDAN003878 [Ephemera danica]|nr:hypothetical protein B566_EDAN003878 [Ephemera danica]